MGESGGWDIGVGTEGTHPIRNGLSMKSVRASSLTSNVMAMGMKMRVKACTNI